jgi:mannose-6-phosphate isomerase
MEVYPVLFEPIYKEKIWGGRNLERLFDRALPDEVPVGESWELADLTEGVSIVRNGPERGRTLTDLTTRWGEGLLGRARPMDDGRFPLLLKLLDANDVLSLQVHPDAEAVRKFEGAALKTECWYVIESRGGAIYKGMTPGTTPKQFQKAIENDAAEQFVRKIDCRAGDFHYLPAGTVHALGAGLVVAEAQTPSDTTFRVTDWGRGREIHVAESMQCIHFEPAEDIAPGAGGEVLLATDFFTVAKRSAAGGQGGVNLPAGRCAALMILTGENIAVFHDGEEEPQVYVNAGDTILLPAALQNATLKAAQPATWLEITLPEKQAT